MAFFSYATSQISQLHEWNSLKRKWEIWEKIATFVIPRKENWTKSDKYRFIWVIFDFILCEGLCNNNKTEYLKIDEYSD